MGLGTFEEYVERLKKMKPNVYFNGKKWSRDHDFQRGGLATMKQTYDCAHDPQYEEYCTAISHLTGEKINRFTHIHRTKEDLLKKQQMTRLLCHRVGGCIQRCMGTDALNALDIVTYDCDQANGTTYHARFEEYLRYSQKHDLLANCAQTDVKGVRCVRPSEQPDPDQYVHIVDANAERDGVKGIVVRGAKLCNSNAPYVDEIIVLPTRLMKAEDAEYAVAFALPADWDGIKILAVPANHPRRSKLKSPMSDQGYMEAMTVFDDVFVPNERVFLNGLEHPDVVQYAGYLALMFAHFHRHSYCGCKAAVSEVIAAEAALVADLNGISKKDHVREKLSHLIGNAELIFAAGEASAHRAVEFPNGSWVPDEVLTNAGRRLAGQEIYREYEILADLTGGMCTSLPTEETFYDPEVSHLCYKYITRNPKYTPEEAHRIFRMTENMLCDPFEGAMMVAGVHGGGSPLMETITMMSRYDMTPLMDLAKYLCGMREEAPFYIRPTSTPRAMLDKFQKSQAKE